MRFFGCYVLFLAVFCLHPFKTHAQARKAYQFAVFFTTKQPLEHLLSTPEKFLAARAILRKQSRNILITPTDLPVVPAFVDTIKQAGFYVHATSKWFNCAIVFASSKQAIDSLLKFSFVRQVIEVGQANWPKASGVNLPIDSIAAHFITKQNNSINNLSVYGKAVNQTQFNQTHVLHKAGLTGHQTLVAVIDAGFSQAHQHPVFAHAFKRVKATYDVVEAEQNVFDDDEHGTAVWSCMAAQDSFSFIGTAPQASYVLLRSEDVASEFPVEEFYWAIAAEFADSCGADIISSSVGYTTFDDAKYNYQRKALGNDLAWISQAAKLANDKGMMVVNSAGNEGDNKWRTVAFPADVASVLTIGAVNAKSKRAGFSSIGWVNANQVKPDVMALGDNVLVANDWGRITYGSGTSYATPIFAGALACAWPALNGLSNQQIVELIHLSSSQYDQPTKQMGYGLTNMWLVYLFAQSYTRDTLLDLSLLPDGYYHAAGQFITKQKITIHLYAANHKLIDSLVLKVDAGNERVRMFAKEPKYVELKMIQVITNTTTIEINLP